MAPAVSPRPAPSMKMRSFRCDGLLAQWQVVGGQPIRCRDNWQNVNRFQVSGQCRKNVRVGEVVADEEEWFIEVLCQRVGKAIAKVELCGMPGPTPESLMSIAGEACLLDGDRLDDNPKTTEQLIERNSVARSGESVNNDRGFEEIGC